MEGAARTPEGQHKAISFRMQATGGLLSVLCENTFDGHVKTNKQGAIQTPKAGPSSHGFSLTQMRSVARKYKSSLDVRWTKERFTVQTALQKPLE